ncbi:MAG: hypothetical protein IPF54_21180 [Draconibacterium sp.]|nr:hypothetical protein [Draconibacterium sp.]
MNIFQNKNQQINNLVASALSEVFGKACIINAESALGWWCINNALKLETNCGNFF